MLEREVGPSIEEKEACGIGIGSGDGSDGNEKIMVRKRKEKQRRRIWVYQPPLFLHGTLWLVPVMVQSKRYIL